VTGAAVDATRLVGVRPSRQFQPAEDTGHGDCLVRQRHQDIPIVAMTPSVSPDREERQSAVLEATVSSYTGDVETYVGKLTGRVHRSGRGSHLRPRTFLAVDVVNGEDVPVDIVIQTPGKELTRLFPARATTLPPATSP
jgi:hypothetical protein